MGKDVLFHKCLDPVLKRTIYKQLLFTSAMKKVVLDSGLTIVYEEKKGNAVVVEVMVKVGSNHETKEERGISHFLEHILFEGTTKRPTNLAISNEIEKIGGEFNAYTTNDRTNFYVKVLKKHFNVAVDVLSDIFHNSLFTEKHVEKEKNIVLKEIDMVYDEPRYYQWVLLQQTLFQKHPCRFPTYGDRDVIKKLTKEQVLAFFHKYYVPSNMVITVVGDVPKWKEIITNNFNLNTTGKKPTIRVKEPKRQKNVTKKEKRNIVNSYVVIGFNTVPRPHKDTYVLDVINGIVGRGQSGTMFTEIRSKLGLAYDVGTQHIGEVSFGYFAVHATIDKKNIATVRKVILQEMQKLAKVTEEQIAESKAYIEGDYLLEIEDAQKRADQLLFWEHISDARHLKDYIQRIKKVTKKDIQRVVKTYFSQYVTVVVEGK